MFTLAKFNPSLTVVSLFDRTITVDLVRLKYEVWVIENYKSVMEFITKFAEENNPTVAVKLFYQLTKDQWKSEEAYLLLWAKASNADLSTVQRAVYESYMNAQPDQAQIKIEKEFAEALNKQGGKACYATHYDLLASRYGYTIEDFYNLTLRQLHGLIKIIDKDRARDLEVQAKLHGMKMKPTAMPLNVNTEEDTKMDDEAQDMLKRMNRDHVLKGLQNGK